MFRKSTPREEVTPRIERRERTEQSFLQAGVRVEGEIHADGDLRIDGQAKGNIRVAGILTIGPRAVITANIRCGSVSIHGSVDGHIQADERVQLARGARVKADLHCSSLVIDEGVFFQGRSHMGEGASAKEAEKVAAGRPEAARDRLASTQSPPARDASLRPEPAAVARPNPLAASPSEPPRSPLDGLRRGPAASPVGSQHTPETPAGRGDAAAASRAPAGRNEAIPGRPIQHATSGAGHAAPEPGGAGRGGAAQGGSVQGELRRGEPGRSE